MTPVLAAANDPAVREIALVCGSQMSKTESLLNLIGHRFDHGPRTPTMIVQPTSKLAKSFSDDRLRKMLRSTKTLWEKLEKGQRDRMTEKFIAGVALRLGWAGSATELASHPFGLVLVDERDRMGQDVAGEGDPVILAKARGKNYPRFTLVVTSTPTIEDASPIQSLFDLGSLEFWQWQCPHCDDWFRPQIKLLKWPRDATPDEASAQAAVHCPECGAAIPESAKPALNEAGRYARHKRTPDGDYIAAAAPPPLGPSRSFWVSGLCSPWTSAGMIAGELAKAYKSGDQEIIQSVVNTFGGEVYRTRGDSPPWQSVRALAKPRPPGEIDPGVKMITLGADVQQHAIYYVIRGWGFNMSSWLIRNDIIHGQTEFDDVWLTLDNVLNQSFGPLRIARAFVDSGYKPGSDYYRRPDHQVYTYARRHAGTVYATKGRDGLDRPIKSSQVDVNHGGVVLKNGLTLWHIDTDYCKTWIYARIRWPEDAESGHWHLHADVDEDYCRQVVSEEVLTKSSGRRVWISRRSRPNHYLDAEVNALAAAMSLHAQAIPEHAETPIQTEPSRASRQRQQSSRFARRTL